MERSESIRCQDVGRSSLERDLHRRPLGPHSFLNDVSPGGKHDTEGSIGQTVDLRDNTLRTDRVDEIEGVRVLRELELGAIARKLRKYKRA
jgi:hypothetical protein